MKHLLKIVLGLVLCLGLFTACDDEEDNAAVSGFSLSKTEVAANAEGGKETVTVLGRRMGGQIIRTVVEHFAGQWFRQHRVCHHH